MLKIGGAVYQGIFLAIFVLGSQSAYAGLGADLSVAGGYTKPSVAAGESPIVSQLGLSLGLSYPLYSWISLGVQGQYRMVNQHSQVDANVGNYRGTFTSYVSPTLALAVGDLMLQFDYLFMGDYKLANARSSGAEVTYTKPSGYRASLGYQYSKGFFLGAFYEALQFGSAKDSLAGEGELLQKQQFNQYGIFIKYFLFGGFKKGDVD